MELRDEIIESQKARTDLFKWKIILVAALGAIALGFEGSPQSPQAIGPTVSREYLLCYSTSLSLRRCPLQSHEFTN
jgi:hypothetical protein